jgi:hypothetical protein
MGGVRARRLVPHMAPVSPWTFPCRASCQGRFVVNPVGGVWGLLGLFTARRRVGADGHIIVWPRLRP